MLASERPGSAAAAWAADANPIDSSSKGGGLLKEDEGGSLQKEQASGRRPSGVHPSDRRPLCTSADKEGRDLILSARS
jgi:hypothetical protein